jgi:2-oxoglutarate ferredoxin oxidoreductase subunit delta
MAKVTIQEEVCKGCGLCTTACPKKLVVLSKDKLNSKGYHPAEISDPSACVACAMCAVICPDVAIIVTK